mgnify:CR=1 FL=1
MPPRLALRLLPLAMAFAAVGHRVTGIDVDAVRVADLNALPSVASSAESERPLSSTPVWM